MESGFDKYKASKNENIIKHTQNTMSNVVSLMKIDLCESYNFETYLSYTKTPAKTVSIVNGRAKATKYEKLSFSKTRLVFKYKSTINRRRTIINM